MKKTWLLMVFLFGLLAACSGNSGGGGSNVPSSGGPQTPAGYEIYTRNGGVPRPNNAIDVYIAYSLASEAYLPEIIRRFNQSYADGKNPLTGAALANGERPIYVWGTPPTSGSSGTQAQGIVNAIIAPNNANVLKPTIFQPSVSHWLSWVNFNASRPIFDVANSPGTALTPVLIAIWEDRLQQLEKATGKKRGDIGWEDILNVLKNGWPEGRKAVYYGHTDPTASSTGLSTTISEFYACARADGFTSRRLTADEVNKKEVQDCMKSIQQLVRHYSTRTEDFLDYFGQGPDYLDMLGMEETRLLCVNLGRTLENVQCLKPQGGNVVGLYPKEGLFWHENPFGIVNADWVTQEQKDAAKVFTDFVRGKDSQTYITEFGYRPVNPAEVKPSSLFVEANGVQPQVTAPQLDIPDISVINAIQGSWSLVKKQADVVILLDISGSMNDNGKIDQAKQAAQTFLDKMAPGNRVGLTVFSDQIQNYVPLGTLETVKGEMKSSIQNIRADGGTALYDAVAEVVGNLNKDPDQNRIRAVVLLSDGADTASSGSLNDAVQAISASRDSLNPVIFVPLAYGSDADVQKLNDLARASRTKVLSGDPSNITSLLQLLSSYF
jgi:Ca-activated chloride channel family protein